MDINPSRLQERVEDRGADALQSMGLPRVGHDLVTEQRKLPHDSFKVKLPISLVQEKECFKERN